MPEYIVRIAHISDLHLRQSLPGTSRGNRRLSRRMVELFSRAIRRMAEMKPDMAVVTGDILDYPGYAYDDADMKRRALEDLHTVRDLLDTLGCPFVVVYGNHDHPDLTTEVFPLDGNDLHVLGHRVIHSTQRMLDHVPQRMGLEREQTHRVLEDDSDVRRYTCRLPRPAGESAKGIHTLPRSGRASSTRNRKCRYTLF